MQEGKVKGIIENINNGEPKQGKFGEYYAVGLKLDSLPEWVNGFFKYPLKNKVGEEIEIEVTKNESNGKTYWNFKVDFGQNKKSSSSTDNETIQLLVANSKLHTKQIASIVEEVKRLGKLVEGRPEVSFDSKKEEEQVKKDFGIEEKDGGIDPDEIDF